MGISQVRLRAGWINTDEKGSHVSLDGLRVQLKTIAISADIDLREGQVVLIGKAGPDGLVVAMAKVSE
jgi:predicted RNA binding protein YcfA (HicA-like mRNA interferase family)